MGKPSAPTPPDPRQTASAQTGTNVGTSIANTLMGQVNQNGPNGSLNYAQTGATTYTDPYTNQTYQIPQFTATTTLSPQAQQIQNANQQAQLGLANVASSQADRLGTVLGQDFNPTNLPAYGTVPGQTQFAFQGGNAGVRGAPVNGGAVTMATQSGNTPSRAAASTDLVGFTPGANVPRVAAQATDVQGSVAAAPAIQNRDARGGNITRSYGTDFSDDRQRVEAALLARMQPQLDQQQSALDAQLVNQGIGRGSRAFSAAQGDLSQARNDAVLSTILAGGQEQSRLAGLEAQRAGFQNQAQSQAFGQDASNIGMRAGLQAQQFGQNVTQGQFANQAAAQEYGQNANQVNQQAALAQQQFGQNLTQNQFRNQAAGQQFAQNQSAVGQQAALGQQQFAQNLAQNQFGNQAQAQNFAQQMAQRELLNTAAQQNYQNRFNATSQNNANLATLFGQGMQQFGAQNGLRGQALSEQFAMRNQPINEIAALLSGSQVQMPNFGIAQPSSIPTTNVAGLIGENYAQRANNYTNQMNLWQSGIGGLFGLGASALGGL